MDLAFHTVAVRMFKSLNEIFFFVQNILKQKNFYTESINKHADTFPSKPVTIDRGKREKEKTELSAS